MIGSPASPSEFARRDAAALVGYLVKLGLRYEDAQDLAAETMRRMCEKWASIESPRAWAHATAFRLAVDRQRKDRANREKVQPRLASQAAGPAADDLYMLKEEQRTVIAHIRELPNRQREVLALHLDGFTNVEIAESLAMNVKTVASHLRHAKRRLREVLEAEGVYPTSTAHPRRGE